MGRLKSIAALLTCALVLSACDNPQQTVDQLRQDLIAYRGQPSDEGKTKIEAGFAKLDQQIAKLNEKGESLKADTLQRQRDDLATDYATAQFGSAVKSATDAIKNFGKAFEKAGKEFSDTLKNSTNQP